MEDDRPPHRSTALLEAVSGECPFAVDSISPPPRSPPAPKTAGTGGASRVRAGRHSVAANQRDGARTPDRGRPPCAPCATRPDLTVPRLRINMERFVAPQDPTPEREDDHENTKRRKHEASRERDRKSHSFEVHGFSRSSFQGFPFHAFALSCFRDSQKRVGTPPSRVLSSYSD